MAHSAKSPAGSPASYKRPLDVSRAVSSWWRWNTTPGDSAGTNWGQPARTIAACSTRQSASGPGRARTRSVSPRSLRAALLKWLPVSERGQRIEDPKPPRGEASMDGGGYATVRLAAEAGPLDQLPVDTPAAAAEERLERNLTPGVAEAGEGWSGYLRYAAGALVAV